MAAADNIVLLAVVSGVGAYVLNVGGFRDWLNTQITGGESEIYTDGEFGEGKKTTSSTSSNPCAGGNVSWIDPNYAKCSNGMVCWSNVPCGGTKKVAVCGSGFTRDGIRNAWIAKYKCKTVGTTPPPPVSSCTGACPPGKRWAIVNGRCACAACKNTCDKCSDRGLNCQCKVNPNKVSYSDQYCKQLCNGMSCWTNYPCPNRGARAQRCVKGTCAHARAAWLAAYSCKSSFAYARQAEEMRITIG